MKFIGWVLVLVFCGMYCWDNWKREFGVYFLCINVCGNCWIKIININENVYKLVILG